MGDLFHESAPWEFQRDVFEHMACARQHQFLVLTKRSKEMAAALRDIYWGWEQRAPFYPGTGEHVESPSPNVWLGVSIEDQKTADERIPLLLQTPAAHYWLSVEPHLGPVSVPPELLRKFGLVVDGGESGRKARPMNPDWARSLRDQCAEAGVPFFMKQMSRHEPIPDDLNVRQLPPEVAAIVEESR